MVAMGKDASAPIDKAAKPSWRERRRHFSSIPQSCRSRLRQRKITPVFTLTKLSDPRMESEEHTSPQFEKAFRAPCGRSRRVAFSDRMRSDLCFEVFGSVVFAFYNASIVRFVVYQAYIRPNRDHSMLSRSLPSRYRSKFSACSAYQLLITRSSTYPICGVRRTWLLPFWPHD